MPPASRLPPPTCLPAFGFYPQSESSFPWFCEIQGKKKPFPQICYLGSLLLCVAYLVVITSLFPSPLILRVNVQIDDTLKLMAA